MAQPFELIQKGIELIDKDNFSDAEKWILRGIQQCKKQKDEDGVLFGLGRLGYCYEKAGQDEKAIGAYEQAVSGGTDIPSTFYNLISLLVKTGMWDKAFHVASIWSEREIFSPHERAEDIFISLGSSFIYYKEAKKAYDLLTRTLDCYSPQKYPNQYWNIKGLLGQAQEKMDNIETAMAIYTDAIALGSTDKTTFKRYLILLEKQKKYENALKIIKKALNIQNDVGWEVDLKKRRQRILKKQGEVPTGDSVEVIPDFSIQKGEQNIRLLQQIQFSPQLQRMIHQDNIFYGVTGGKNPKLFAQAIDQDARLWEISIETTPNGMHIGANHLILYKKKGTVTKGETKLNFFDLAGNFITSATLPGVPSQIVVAGKQIYAGCRDGNLYALSCDGKPLWSYTVPGSSTEIEDDGFRPCPYYEAANPERVAFTSFDTLFVLDQKGKLLYKWIVPDQVSKSKGELVSITYTMSGGSATALAIAPEGERIWVGVNDTLFALDKGRISNKITMEKYNSINSIDWCGPGRVAVSTYKQVDLIEKNKKVARIPANGSASIFVKRSVNQIAVCSEKHIRIATVKGTVLAEIEFAKAVNYAAVLAGERLLVGTRYAILFDTDLERVTKQKRSGSETSSRESVEKSRPSVKRLDSEEGFPVIWKSTKKISVTSGKAVYLGVAGAELTIEQAVLEQFIAEGYKGLWSENDAWWQIMALLFWDVVFVKLPGVFYPQFGTFPGVYQDMPNDFFKPEFNQRRKDMIEKRIKDFTQAGLFGLGKKDAATEIRKSYHNHHGQPCRPIEDWNRVNINALVFIVNSLSSQQLMGVMSRLLRNYNENRSGLPDLFLTHPSGKPLFVEVKSEREKVADHQWAWARYIHNNLGVPFFVCRVTHKTKE